MTGAGRQPPSVAGIVLKEIKLGGVGGGSRGKRIRCVCTGATLRKISQGFEVSGWLQQKGET